jgi:hypothetical protein
LNFSIAAVASSSVEKVTNQKPLGLQVSLSFIMIASSTVQHSQKSSANCSLFVDQEILDTNSLLFILYIIFNKNVFSRHK